MDEGGRTMLDLRALLWSVLAMGIALLVIVLIERWWIRRSVASLIAQIRHNTEREMDDRPRLQPESQYVVQVSESILSCTHPDNTIERVAWDDLQRVEILTTDQGPFVPDVFWVLHGSKSGCVVPQGATGERELMERLQRLHGFRNDVVIEAMPSTETRRFTCWEKTGNVE
jgi:hypothetical protein